MSTTYARWPRIAVVLASAVLMIAGCSGGSTGSKTPSATQTAAAPATSARGPGTYKAVDNLCDAVDTAAMADLYPSATPSDHRNNKVGAITSMNCGVVLDAGQRHAIMLVTAQVFPDADSAAATYEGLRGVETNTVTDLPGIGAAAYTYADPLTGSHVVARDGNLYLTVGMKAQDSVASPD